MALQRINDIEDKLNNILEKNRFNFFSDNSMRDEKVVAPDAQFQ